MSVEDALAEALETTPRLPRDAAAVQLALRYAEALDDCFEALSGRGTDPGAEDAAEDPATHARVILEIARLGQRLEAMLDRLGMAPGSRPAITGSGGEGGGTDPASAALEQQRRDAAAGAPSSGLDYAAAVDPAVTEADAVD
jgi:hypothetical protein